MTWGILGALDQEVALIKKNMQVDHIYKKYGTTFYTGQIKGKAVVLAACGIGKVNAAVCTAAVLNEFGADCVINVGIAGAMHSDLHIMDVVIGSEVGFHDQDPIMLNYYPKKEFFGASTELVALCEKVCCEMNTLKGNHYTGRIMSGDVFVNDPSVKQCINEHYAPYCVEMEGASIGHVAYMHGKPFLVIRTMSDSADEEADQSYDNFIDVAAHQSASIILKMLAE